MLQFMMFGGIAVAAFACAVEAKTGPTYYTPQRIAAARENVERHPWAQSLMRRIRGGDGFRYYIGPEYGPADRYIDQTDEFMWMLQPTTKIGRVVPGEYRAIDPVQGTEARKIDPWCPYNIDPINRPYKIQSKLTDEWYPSNDYHLGDMTNGDFPDDGEGIHCENGLIFYALREYAHMVYGSAVIPALRSLSQAYLITGDTRYARKGAILLARLAHEFPNQTDRIDRMYFAQYGMRSPQYAWKTGGRISDLIWETFLSETAIYAYDALFDYLDQDPDMIAFLRSRGMPIDDAGDLRRYIERYLVGSVMEGLLDGSIHGNEGFHQATALTCALVLDRYDGPEPNSKTMVDWAFHGPGASAFVMINGLSRDGGGHESPGYNKIKLDFARVNELMREVRQRRPELFPEERYPDIFAADQARRLFDNFIDIQMLDAFMPAIGDSGGIGPVRRNEPRQWSYITGENLYAFARYGDPRYARAATNMEGKVFDGQLFEPFPTEDIHIALQSPGSIIKRESRLIDGYGVSIFESGAGEHRRAVMLNYTSLVGHRQSDELYLELYARGVSLLPDLGYPRTWTYTTRFDTNSLTHNTVTVDETPPGWVFGGICRLFHTGNGVHVVTASHDPYRLGSVPLGKPDAKAVDLYERTVVMVDLDEERFYVVDLFAVNGGEQHDQSWHALLEDVTPPDLDWATQDGGTLAGPDVGMYGNWTDRWGRSRDDAFSFMAHVRRATLEAPAAWTWYSGLDKQDAVRLHVVPVDGPVRIIQAKGKTPVRPDDWWLDYTFVRREVDNGEASRFLTVIEAFQHQQPVIRGVKVVNQAPLTVEIAHVTGTDRITLDIPLTSSSHGRHRALGVRVESEGRDVGVGSLGGGYHQTRITAVDYDTKQITIDDDPAVRIGAPIRIHSDNRSSMYHAAAVHRRDGKCIVTLDATAVFARGPVTGVGEGRVDFGTSFIFATGRLDSQGRFVPGCDPHIADELIQPGWDRFAGSWIGQGEHAYRLRGATRPQIGHGGELEPNTTINAVFLEEPVAADTLRQAFGDRIVTIWDFGVGDAVEVARVTK